MRQNQSLLTLSALSILFCPQVLGQEVKIEASPGLYVTTLQTPKGNIRAYLPDGLAAGDTISGIVIMEPAGGTEKEKSRNRNELSGYFIELEKEKIPLTQTRLKWTIPSTLTGGATFLVLRDRNGNELSRAVVPVRVNTTMLQQRMNASLGEYHCPMVGRAGTPIQIQGPFDGNFDNTNLSIGGKKAENGKTEKGESHKEDFFPEQTPFPTKNIIAKTVPKARVIEKHASTSHFTRGLTEGGSKKKETISNDIAAVAPIESDGRYTIEVASYNSEDDAKDFAEELKSRGYPAFITQGGVPGRGTWYRVRVGKFKTVRARLFAYGLKGQEREIQSFLITEIN